MGLWRDEVAVLFVRQVTAQALPYVKPALKRPACCIIVITVTKSQAAQIKPITAHHANQLYQHGTLALLVPGLLEGTTTIGELLTHGDTGIGTGEGLDGELIILDGVAYKVGQSGVAERVPDDFTMPFANVHHAAFNTSASAAISAWRISTTASSRRTAAPTRSSRSSYEAPSASSRRGRSSNSRPRTRLWWRSPTGRRCSCGTT